MWKYRVELKEPGSTKWIKIGEYASKERAIECMREEIQYQKMGWNDPDNKYQIKRISVLNTRKNKKK